MSKDYKGPARKPAGGKGGAGSLLIGILIGLLLGLGIAPAVAWYINKMPTPFVNRAAPPLKSESLKNTDTAKGEDKAAKVTDGKPRFDFYKILPGSEEPVTEQPDGADAGGRGRDEEVTQEDDNERDDERLDVAPLREGDEEPDAPGDKRENGERREGEDEVDGDEPVGPPMEARRIDRRSLHQLPEL